MSGIPQGLVVFNTFIDDLDHWTEYTLCKTPNCREQWKSWRGGLPSKGPQKDERMGSQEFKFKGKCQVLHLRQNNPVQCFRMETYWLKSSSKEKD